jgi:hypothetical protein
MCRHGHVQVCVGRPDRMRCKCLAQGDPRPMIVVTDSCSAYHDMLISIMAGVRSQGLS